MDKNTIVDILDILHKMTSMFYTAGDLNKDKVKADCLKKITKLKRRLTAPPVREKWNLDWEGDPDDPNRWRGW